MLKLTNVDNQLAYFIASVNKGLENIKKPGFDLNAFKQTVKDIAEKFKM
jgi:hypothetical protein